MRGFFGGVSSSGRRRHLLARFRTCMTVLFGNVLFAVASDSVVIAAAGE